MSKRKRYKFNKETLSYELHRIPLRERFSKGFILFILSVFAFVGYYAFYTMYLGYQTPKTMEYKRESAELHSKLDLINKKFERDYKILTELELRDNNVYRPIFGMEEISQGVRNAGFGGVDRYSYLDNIENSGFLADVEKSMDILYKKAFIQSRSYDEVMFFAKKTEDMALCVPAIPPVALEHVKLSSLFGFRRDPFDGNPRMHQGIDLSGRKGEPVYATGNGKVVEIAFNFFGYGTEIIVDHGFGYKTRYAHLQRTLVREGDIVQRGQQIATIGNTGRSQSDHLHYEVMYRNNRVNPLNYYNQELKGEQYRAMIKPIGKVSNEQV